jgi:hypothetical protein
VPAYPFAISQGWVCEIDPLTNVASEVGSIADWLSDGDISIGSPYVPILAYGSNACPGRLVQKLTGRVFGAAGLDRIVVFPVTMCGAARAWASRITKAGVLPFTVIADSKARESAHVIVLPSAFVPSMDQSEGRGGPVYSAVRLDHVTVELPGVYGTWHTPLTYLGHGRRAPLVWNDVAQTPSNLSRRDAEALVRSMGARGNDALLPAHRVIPDEVAIASVVERNGSEKPIMDYLFSKGD